MWRWLRQIFSKRAGYRIYTVEFDRELPAKDVPSEQSRRYRTAAPDIAELRSVLTTVEQDAQFEALTQAFAHRVSRELAPTEQPLVTILVDHSGSMRGHRAQQAVGAVHLMATMLEEASIPFEVLGFTTSSWKGGKSREHWTRHWRPYPGRLCDLLHIVYRDATSSNREEWRNGLTLLLDDDFLKENVDGEALLWARSRAELFVPKTWVCVVLSDGAPVDDSTLTYNEDDILFNHLKQVIAGFESLPNVRIGALGLGYDVRSLYANSEFAKTLPIDLAMPAELLERLVFAPSRD